MTKYQIISPWDLRKVDIITSVVCDWYDVTRTRLVGKFRLVELTEPRHIAIYLVRETTKLPTKTVGYLFGNRDHSTIVHAHHKIERLVQSDELFARKVADIKQEVLNRLSIERVKAAG